MGKDRAFLNRIGHAPEPLPEAAKIWRADQRLSTKVYAPGTRVRYGCTPPLKGVVVKRDGGSHWVEFPVHGVLRCNTFDLKVLKEGE